MGLHFLWYLSKVSAYFIFKGTGLVDEVGLHTLIHELDEALLPLLMLSEAAILTCYVLSSLRARQRRLNFGSINGHRSQKLMRSTLRLDLVAENRLIL